MEKKVYTHIQGGIGNQLFIFFSSYFFAKKNNAKLYVEELATNFFDLKFKRKSKLDNFKNLIKKSNFHSTILFSIYRIINKFYKLPKIFSIKLFRYKFSFFNDLQQNFSESFFKQYRMSTNERVYLIGYWQNIKYFDLKNIPILKLKNNKNNIYKKINKKDIAIHFRGGERLNPKVKKHSYLTKITFYKKALSYFLKLNINSNYHIFTDDINYGELMIKKLKIKKKIIFINKSTNVDLEQFLMLTRYQNYIIANSTFSLLPALINRNSKKIICLSKRWGKGLFPDSLMTKEIKLF
jgi:hypothetical protein